MRLNERVELHTTLNPKIWTDDNNLRLEVENKLVVIVKKFISELAITPSVADVHIVGSNASYNYTEHSDLDVHVIVNFETLDAPLEILQALFNAEKTAFNKNHDITIHGIPVEMYIEDVNSTALSNGVYSLLTREWIKFPQPIQAQSYDLTDAISRWKNVVSKCIEHGASTDIEQLINQLYMIRKNSLAAEGEYGKGNQLFKEIRDIGLLDALKEARIHKQSQELSVECLEEDHAVK